MGIFLEIPICFYNASIFSALLRHISPVAWQHSNFYGRFEFTSISLTIDIASIVQTIIARSMPPDTAYEL